MFNICIMGSSTKVVERMDSRGQWYLVVLDRFGCELSGRVFVGVSVKLADKPVQGMLPGR